MNTSLAEVRLHHQNSHLRVGAGALILRVRHRLVWMSKPRQKVQAETSLLWVSLMLDTDNIDV